MSDVLTITDLEIAKKHDTFHSEVITGKAGGSAIGAEIDTATNAVTGQVQATLPKVLRDVGFKPASFTFVTGGTLGVTDADKCIYNPAPAGDNNWYSWGGVLPHTVAPGANPTLAGSGYVPRTDAVLRAELASHVGAGMLGFSHDVAYSQATAGFRLKNAVYATDSPFNAPTDGSDAASHINAALTYCAANDKDLILDRLFTAGSTISIPSNVSVTCLTRQCGINSTAVGSKAVSVAGINSRFIGGTIKGLNNPASTTIRQDGVSMEPTSSFCEIVDVHVYGFFAKGFTGSGAGVGVLDRGVSNKIKSCRVIDSKFCVNLMGKKGEVSHNYISNHYLTQTVEAKPWTSASNYWDGIVSEGIEDYLIAFNEVTECGQSGIYTGGNGGLSKSNRIIGNLVEKCWNRGIDQGVNEAQSASNDVIGQVITSNICRNNRENNIWLAGTSRCKVSTNSSIYDAEYATLFAGYYGGHTGIALANGGTGVVPHGNTINDNSCEDSEGYANISISCGLTASGNIIGGNATPQSIYLVSESLFARNEFNFTKEQSWSPSLIGGGGSISLGASPCKTVTSGRTAKLEVNLNVASVSSASGPLVIGYVPPLSGTQIRLADLRITLYDGLDSSIGASQLLCYMSSPDQITVARVLNGTRYYDVRAFLKAGSTLSIAGTVEFYA